MEKKKYAQRKGRESKTRFVALPFYMLRSEAYKSLSPWSRATYTCFKMQYNSLNNGEIHYSVRRLANELGCSINTSRKSIEELEKKGFLKCRFKGKFDQKAKRASEFILTEYEYNGQIATKDFMKWQRPKVEKNTVSLFDLNDIKN